MFLSKLPAAGALLVLQKTSADIAEKRIRDGSTSKDLYHYLVCRTHRMARRTDV